MVKKKKKILFVCTGNLCRSVIAEMFLKKIASEKALALDVISRGMMAVDGEKPPYETEFAAQYLGIDISSHRAHSIRVSDVDWADEILVMEPWHKESLETLGGKGRIKGLWEFSKNRLDLIEDPFGKSLNDHIRIADIIKDAIINWINKNEQEGFF